MNSLEIREFTLSLQTFVEKSSLPLELKSMIFQSMANDLKRMANEEVHEQLVAREENKENEERTEEE